MVWDKKGQGSKSFSFLIKILLILSIAAALIFMVRRIAYAFIPK